MLGFIIGLMMLLSVLLIIVILPQQSAKSGGGIGAAAGASQMLGVQKTTDLMEKLTWGLMIAIFVLALITNFFK